MTDDDAKRVLEACPICQGAGTYTHTYHEHGDSPVYSERPCYNCQWVRHALTQLHQENQSCDSSTS